MTELMGSPGARSLDLLELPRVREILAGLATSHLGRRRVAELRPFPTVDEAVEMLHHVDSAAALAASGRGLPAMEVGDLEGVFRRLDHPGAVLAPDEFLALAPLLAAVASVRRMLDAAASSHPDFAALGIPLRPLPHLERALEQTFEPTGEVRDTASPELRAIRREREQLRERLRRRLDRMASSLAKGEADSVVTLREGRYVLSVPGHLRGEVKGLVQDRSASGATFYMEPFDTVEDNNALREKEIEEREEIRRILTALTAAFARERAALEEDWERLGRLDAIRSRALLARRWGGEVPELVERPELRLRGARHPLLLEARGADRSLAEARESVIPLDLELDGDTRFLLLTGPNMGGKTVALKCVGLLCALAASGCLVPVDPGCRIPWVTAWVVDLGDEQSLDQDLSTFGAHLKRWAEALKAAGPTTLVLLDELGAGTDPLEGSALARSILERLLDRGGLGVVTTHASALKGFAAETPGIRNASMVFDADTERPTFRIAVGMPGESHALSMARRLGFPADVVDRAEALLPREERELRRLLAEVEAERARLREREAEASALRREAEAAAREARSGLEKFLEERSALRARAARQAREILRRAEEEARSVGRRERGDTAARAESRRKLAREQARLARLEAPRPARPAGVRPEAVHPGERYWADGLAREVEVLQDGAADGRVLVRHGGLKVELPVASLRTLGGEIAPAATQPSDREGRRPRGGVTTMVDADAVSPEVDLRGMRAHEAIEKLDLALDRALLSGLKELRVIHGIGTGALRKAVVTYCRSHSAVKEFRLGERHEGGDGATVIVLEA